MENLHCPEPSYTGYHTCKINKNAFAGSRSDVSNLKEWSMVITDKDYRKLNPILAHGGNSYGN